MIKATATTVNGAAWEETTYVSPPKTPSEALSLIVDELARSAAVMEVTSTTIVLHAPILYELPNSYWHVVYEGDEESMRVITELARIHNLSPTTDRDVLNLWARIAGLR